MMLKARNRSNMSNKPFSVKLLVAQPLSINKLIGNFSDRTMIVRENLARTSLISTCSAFVERCLACIAATSYMDWIVVLYLIHIHHQWSSNRLLDNQENVVLLTPIKTWSDAEFKKNRHCQRSLFPSPSTS